MTDEVDITAPVLPKVDERPETTAPALPPVADTRDALDPVEPKPATTLELEDDSQEDIVTRRRRLPAVAGAEPPPAMPAAGPPAALDVVAAAVPARPARHHAALGSDGFEGTSLPALAPAPAPVTSRSARLAASAQRVGWLIIALTLAGLVLLGVLLARL